MPLSTWGGAVAAATADDANTAFFESLLQRLFPHPTIPRDIYREIAAGMAAAVAQDEALSSLVAAGHKVMYNGARRIGYKKISNARLAFSNLTVMRVPDSTRLACRAVVQSPAAHNHALNFRSTPVTVVFIATKHCKTMALIAHAVAFQFFY